MGNDKDDMRVTAFLFLGSNLAIGFGAGAAWGTGVGWFAAGVAILTAVIPSMVLHDVAALRKQQIPIKVEVKPSEPEHQHR